MHLFSGDTNIHFRLILLFVKKEEEKKKGTVRPWPLVFSMFRRWFIHMTFLAAVNFVHSAFVQMLYIVPRSKGALRSGCTGDGRLIDHRAVPLRVPIPPPPSQAHYEGTRRMTLLHTHMLKVVGSLALDICTSLRKESRLCLW